eukprot:scaffold161768_cov12-Tisochrysis_lutea.AAC.1
MAQRLGLHADSAGGFVVLCLLSEERVFEEMRSLKNTSAMSCRTCELIWTKLFFIQHSLHE